MQYSQQYYPTQQPSLFNAPGFAPATTPQTAQNQQGFEQWLQQLFQQRQQQQRQQPLTMANVNTRMFPMRPFNMQDYQNKNPQRFQQMQQQYGLQQSLQQMFPQYAQAVPSLFGFRQY